jgi:ketosteroid isomerase-like protein
LRAEDFAAEWIAAWNAHDLERILSHYAADVVFESPASTRITGDPSGRVVGKAALRDYWRQALERVPDLTFTLRAVYGAAGGLAIRYHSSRTGQEVVEVLRFNEAGLATWAGAYYE